MVYICNSFYVRKYGLRALKCMFSSYFEITWVISAFKGGELGVVEINLLCLWI